MIDFCVFRSLQYLHDQVFGKEICAMKMTICMNKYMVLFVVSNHYQQFEIFWDNFSFFFDKKLGNSFMRFQCNID